MSVELSSLYLDVLKDRLYAESADSPGRRAAQFVLARLHDGLTRLLAPIIPHTAEESWDYLPATPDKQVSVHLADFPGPDPRWDDSSRDARWETLLEVRETILRALEGLRKDKTIGSAQESVVTVTAAAADLPLLEANRELLATLCIVSEIKFAPAAPTSAGPDRFSAAAERSPHAKCERCWNYRPSVGQRQSTRRSVNGASASCLDLLPLRLHDSLGKQLPSSTCSTKGDCRWRPRSSKKPRRSRTTFGRRQRTMIDTRLSMDCESRFHP